MRLYKEMHDLATGELIPSDNDYLYKRGAMTRKHKLDEFLSHPASQKLLQENAQRKTGLPTSYALIFGMACELEMVSAWLAWYSVRGTDAANHATKAYQEAYVKYMGTETTKSA